ncbi:hypothetical protein A3A40_01775 [Candidatus Kaiserbacteria bacterium RIFCSPLOWO2_01_FULL_54_20]|uniref:N-acetyltransferase domain-containing protein n=1 Tax=Candidatus Kaiserbacteria bacterium RIFCSPLOWO2_01_FULL_54_20 TaxID=1798513 RepID=A0A1F6EKE6_9BACT|nr:MAG: hypothetical protein A3A40_01775 [Candidatus Kaiserbacteria bacterium RIFCSPLOWO2_01_FULL_54_20]
MSHTFDSLNANEGEDVVKKFNEADAHAVEASALAKTQDSGQQGSALESMKLQFEPLSPENLAQAKTLCDTVFALEGDAAARDLESSLLPIDRRPVSDAMYSEKRYWIVRDSSGKAVGITGMYGLAGDKPEHCWLGWFALMPGLTGHRLGTQMLDHTMREAGKEGKTDLYVISSDHPDMAGNAKFYRENRCPIVAVLNNSGNHISKDGAELSQPLIRGTREHYQSFIDQGVNIFIRRRSIENADRV